LRRAAAGPRSCALVEDRESRESGERLVRVLALAQLEGVKPDALQEVQVIARDVSDSAQLALVAVAAAQQPGDGKAAPVAELREVDLDARRAVELRADRRRVVPRLETDH